MSEYKTVRELLAEPSRWTQQHAARNSSGVPCNGFNGDAVCFCLAGAITKTYRLFSERRVAAMNIRAAIRKLHPEFRTGGAVIPEFNDTHSHADILRVLEEAGV